MVRSDPVLPWPKGPHLDVSIQTGGGQVAPRGVPGQGSQFYRARGGEVREQFSGGKRQQAYCRAVRHDGQERSVGRATKGSILARGAGRIHGDLVAIGGVETLKAPLAA